MSHQVSELTSPHGSFRKQSSLSLDAESEKLYDLLHALPAAIYTTDALGRITFYNHAAVALWGCRPKLGSKWCGSWRLYRPDGSPMPHDQCPMAIALKEERVVNGQEAMAERPDGTRVPFIAYPSPLRNSSGSVVGAVNMLVEITERKHKEEHIALLAREVDHRSKNLLALVFATVRLTQADTIDNLRTAIEGRLKALANAHALLAQSRWVSADLHTLVAEEVRPYCLEGRRRAEMKGPTLVLSPETAQSVAIALHELTTNAVKYGSLSVPTGHVEVDWSRTDDGRITLLWAEKGGPAATQPAKRGFGTTVIDRMICDRLNGSVRFDWRRDGLVCEIILHDTAPMRETSNIRPGASAPHSHYESPPVDFSGRSTASSPG